MVKYVLIVMSLMFLLGCEAKQATQNVQPTEVIQDVKSTEEVFMATEDADILYFYVIDDLHRVVGFGSWGDDGLFHIVTLTGKVWDIPATAKIIRSEVTKAAIASQTE